MTNYKWKPQETKKTTTNISDGKQKLSKIKRIFSSQWWQKHIHAYILKQLRVSFDFSMVLKPTGVLNGVCITKNKNKRLKKLHIQRLFVLLICINADFIYSQRLLDFLVSSHLVYCHSQRVTITTTTIEHRWLIEHCFNPFIVRLINDSDVLLLAYPFQLHMKLSNSMQHRSLKKSP